MALREDDRATDFREVDRFDGGVGWLAHPEETMQRASHALAIDDEVWVIDPVDAAGLDDLLAEFGTVAGVVVAMDRHTRDADAIATRHDVPVYLPDWFEGVAEKLEAETPVSRFGAELRETGLEAHVVARGRFWQEVALFDSERGTLVVPESVGTAPYFLAGDEPLGVHPMMRLRPPKSALGRFVPRVERVLVGHGSGVTGDASRALGAALSTARTRAPRAFLENARLLAPF